jgi:hypothetical protein
MSQFTLATVNNGILRPDQEISWAKPPATTGTLVLEYRELRHLNRIRTWTSLTRTWPFRCLSGRICMV